jgi:glycosyltransferase involved in cell wall biosynthesis
MSCPWLSIIIPTYNGEHYLRSALESVLLQRDQDIEIIAVDDGSTDTTVDILESYAQELNIRIIQKSHIGSWVKNTNLGLTIASGDYVCFLHQDDLWQEDRLSQLKSRLAQDRRPVLLLNPSWFIDANGRRVGLWRCPLPAGIALDASRVLERLLVQNFISMPAPLFSREAALEVGGLDEELWYTADWDFWLKLARLGRTIYYPQPLSSFRIHPNSQTVQNSTFSEEFRKQLETVLERHLFTKSDPPFDHRIIARAARYSVEVNTALAAMVHGDRSQLPRLIQRSLTLGASGWCRYIRDSRIIERVVARYRIGLSVGRAG